MLTVQYFWLKQGSSLCKSEHGDEIAPAPAIVRAPRGPYAKKAMCSVGQVCLFVLFVSNDYTALWHKCFEPADETLASLWQQEFREEAGSVFAIALARWELLTLPLTADDDQFAYLRKNPWA